MRALTVKQMFPLPPWGIFYKNNRWARQFDNAGESYVYMKKDGSNYSSEGYAGGTGVPLIFRTKKEAEETFVYIAESENISRGGAEEYDDEERKELMEDRGIILVSEDRAIGPVLAERITNAEIRQIKDKQLRSMLKKGVWIEGEKTWVFHPGS
jgi:hypothetical protein